MLQSFAPYLSVAEVILAITLTILVLLQTKGADLGGFLRRPALNERSHCLAPGFSGVIGACVSRRHHLPAVTALAPAGLRGGLRLTA